MSGDYYSAKMDDLHELDHKREAHEQMLELLQSVAMSPIDLENDGECCMRIKTETMFKIASLVLGTKITEIQTLAGQLVTDAEDK